jgi:hypothetical protein
VIDLVQNEEYHGKAMESDLTQVPQSEYLNKLKQVEEKALSSLKGQCSTN